MDGIRSKSFGKGAPAYIDARGLLNNIRAHINPISTADKAIYDATEFISFSVSRNRALYWLRSKDVDEISPCKTEFEETRYLFRLVIPDNELTALDAHSTMFVFRYKCNPSLKRFNSADVRTDAIFAVTEPGTYFKSCAICNGTERSHSIVLIDSCRYLEHYKTDAASDTALQNAHADEEWLILPIDFDSGRTATTIPRADFWSVELYNAKGESRLPGHHDMLGMVY